MRICLGLLLGAALASNGCSFTFVHGPPANHQRLAFFDCSSGSGLPIIDTIVALAMVGETSDATGSASSGLTSSSKANVAIFAAQAALFGASALYGFKKTADCRDAQAALALRTPRAPAQPVMNAPPIDPWTGQPGAFEPPAPPPPPAAR